MKRRQRKEFAKRIIEMPIGSFKGVITQLIEAGEHDLAVEISKQLRKKIEDKKISLEEKEIFIDKCEIVENEIEKIVESCEQLIVDVADTLDEIDREYDFE